MGSGTERERGNENTLFDGARRRRECSHGNRASQALNFVGDLSRPLSRRGGIEPLQSPEREDQDWSFLPQIDPLSTKMSGVGVVKKETTRQLWLPVDFPGVETFRRTEFQVGHTEPKRSVMVGDSEPLMSRAGRTETHPNKSGRSG